MNITYEVLIKMQNHIAKISSCDVVSAAIFDYEKDNKIWL